MTGCPLHESGPQRTRIFPTHTVRARSAATTVGLRAALNRGLSWSSQSATAALFVLVTTAILVTPTSGGCSVQPDQNGHVNISAGATVIASFAFYQCDELQSVSIPNSVTTIGDSAFAECTQLMLRTLPDALQSIGSSAFASTCSAVIVPLGLPDSVTDIGATSFAFSGLTVVNISRSLRVIPDSAFQGSSVESIVIPNSVTSIGDFAFSSCVYLKTVLFGAGLVELSELAFFLSMRLTSVVIPDNSRLEVTPETFRSCIGYGLQTAEGSTTPRGNVTCVPCGNDADLVIPDNVVAIPELAFAHCASRVLWISDSVTSIAPFAFANNSFSDLVIPNHPNLTLNLTDDEQFEGGVCPPALIRPGAVLNDCKPAVLCEHACASVVSFATASSCHGPGSSSKFIPCQPWLNNNSFYGYPFSAVFLQGNNTVFATFTENATCQAHVKLQPPFPMCWLYATYFSPTLPPCFDSGLNSSILLQEALCDQPRSNALLIEVVAGSVGGALFLGLVLGAVIAYRRRQRKTSAAGGTTADDDPNERAPLLSTPTVQTETDSVPRLEQSAVAKHGLVEKVGTGDAAGTERDAISSGSDLTAKDKSTDSKPHPRPAPSAVTIMSPAVRSARDSQIAAEVTKCHAQILLHPEHGREIGARLAELAECQAAAGDAAAAVADLERVVQAGDPANPAIARISTYIASADEYVRVRLERPNTVV